ncbi:MAG: hypothetical protein AAB316_05925, partial [Bacteroidota bacterium]
ILPLPDGGFLVAGNTYSEDCDLTRGYGNKDWWVFRLDSLGQMLWQKRFGSSANDDVYDVAATLDGDFWLTGLVGKNGYDVTNFHGIFDVWVLKINAFGEKIFARTWGGSKDDRGVCIAAAPGGGCLVLASTESIGGDITEFRGQKDSWLLRFDAQGGLLWQKIIGGDKTDVPVNFLWLPDSTIYLSCLSNSVTHDFDAIAPQTYTFNRPWIFHFSPQGEVLSKWIGDFDSELRLVPAPDGGVFGLGIRNRLYLGSNVYVFYFQNPQELVALKFSPSLSQEWKNVFQVAENDLVTAGLPLPGGELAVAGASVRNISTFSNDSTDAYFLTLHPAPPASFSLGNDTSVCAGQPVLLDASPLQGQGVSDCPDCAYLWNDGLEHPSRLIFPTSTTTWTVTVTTPEGCSQTASRTVSVFPFDVTMQVSDPACGDPAKAIAAVPSGANGAVQFSWSNGSTANQITSLATGTYSVTATDGVCRVAKSAAVGGASGAGFPLADPKITWQGLFGSPGDDQAFSARPTSDGGFIAIGQELVDSPSGGGGGSPHSVIFKFNSQGILEWKTLLDPQDTLTSLAYDLLETPAGDFIFLAQKYWNGNPYVHFYRLDPQGEIEATHSLSSGWLGKNMECNVNGRYLGVASAVIEFDENGSLKRNFELPSYQGHRPPFTLAAHPTGRLEVAFSIPPEPLDDAPYYTNGGVDAGVRHLNEHFQQSSSNSYGNPADDVFEAILATPDSGFVAAGWTNSDYNYGAATTCGKDVWVRKVNKYGGGWSRPFGGDADDVANTVLLDTDGGYLVAGSTRSTEGDVSKNKGGEDAWLLKLDAELNLIWEKTFGGSGDDAFTSLRRLPDGSLLAAGRSTSNDGDLAQAQPLGGSDFWVVRLTLQPPHDFLGKDTTICAAATIVMDATPLEGGQGGCPACTYAWNDGSNLPVRSVLPIFSKTYAVTVTNPNGCTAADTLQITVEPPPNAATLTLSPPLSACPNQEITLTASAPGCTGCSFEWSAGVSPSGVGGGVTATATAIAAGATTYSVTVTSPVGCTVTRSKNLLVHDLKVNVLQNDCSATVQATGGTFGYSFLWENGETDPTIAVPGAAAVTVSDGICDWVEQVVVSPDCKALTVTTM